MRPVAHPHGTAPALRVPTRHARRLAAALAALLLGLVGALALTGLTAQASVAATDDPSVEQPGTLPSVDETPSTSDPSPEPTQTYGEGGAGPHQESGEDQLGPLTQGKTFAILGIIAATLAIIAVIAVRSRRSRDDAHGRGR
ncbi:hypothetical protein CTKZ_34440 [Cellulomonas algicola]|uniref:Uncharacterized protein n=1 Tax=Cellulomonas algicola TaxID=2071633 RepID=A0A401V4Q3_9CELL|nr:hypothetical protein [Cellulomonas algicola]GCD21882.1 hypothetical protein CTKZ_34440 [Cellulomonas algicola]